MQVVIAKDENTAIAIKEFLYRCYIGDLQWEIENINPSQLKIIEMNNKHLLVDDYDDISLWFGVVCNDAIVACARLSRRDSNGLLELERYNNARKAIWPLLQDKKFQNTIEFNREAISSQYKENTSIQLMLLKAAFTYCLDNKLNILSTTCLTEWIRIYRDIAFPQIPEIGFKYFDYEQEAVNVYLAEKQAIIDMLKKIDEILGREKSYGRETFSTIGA